MLLNACFFGLGASDAIVKLMILLISLILKLRSFQNIHAYQWNVLELDAPDAILTSSCSLYLLVLKITLI